MRRTLLGLLPFVAVACTVSANVGDLGGGDAADAGGDAPSSNDGSGSNDVSSPPGPTADGGSDVEPIPIDAGCGVSFAQRGGFVDVGVVMGPAPNLTGGAIVPGLYELTAMRVYFGGDTGTMQVRETMRVRGSTTAGAFDRLTEARSATGTFEPYPLHGETITFQTGAGPTIFLTPECPSMEFESGGRFDMKGETLVLFDDASAIERVYHRVE